MNMLTTTPDLVMVVKPDLTPQARQKLESLSPDWAHVGYLSHAEIEAQPALAAPVLILDAHQKIHDILVAHNRLVFAIMDKTGIIWQLQNYENRAAAISPDLSEILGGHRIRTVPELVSILLEDW